MKNEKMEQMRREINKMMEEDCIDREKLLDKSQELDLLILQHMNNKMLRDKFRRMLGVKDLEELEGLITKIGVFEKMYHALRIVNPITNEVIEIKENKLQTVKSTCYAFWEKQQSCDNCISARAFNEDHIVFKLDYKENDVFMVTALPVIINNHRLVIEFLKNVSNEMFIMAEDGKCMQIDELFKLTHDKGGIN